MQKYPLNNGHNYLRAAARLSIHKRHSAFKRDHKACWTRLILALGLVPEIEIIETVTDSFGWKQREAHWIEHLRKLGCRLTNMTSGGEGITSYRHTAESKKKIGDAAKKKIYTEDYRRKLSITKVGARNPSSKLSVENIRTIRTLLAEGKQKQKQIAVQFGIDQSWVSRIKTDDCLIRCKYNSLFGKNYASTA